MAATYGDQCMALLNHTNGVNPPHSQHHSRGWLSLPSHKTSMPVFLDLGVLLQLFYSSLQLLLAPGPKPLLVLPAPPQAYALTSCHLGFPPQSANPAQPSWLKTCSALGLLLLLTVPQAAKGPSRAQPCCTVTTSRVPSQSATRHC